jgi:hypothetical protein
MLAGRADPRRIGFAKGVLGLAFEIAFFILFI